ncbi:MAG TPA: hypothetical protein VLW50_18095 [Streptosporangiaceae bacterium]|nr:hypothetical protein [Streptosporangiaceae bacterium]
MPNYNARNHRNNPYAFDGIAGRFHHTMAGALWRWRTELVIVGAAGTWAVWLVRHLGPVWAAVAGLAAIAAVMAMPSTRRAVLSRAWCVISRHRLQRLCFETRLHTRSGRLPLILRIHPTKVGERAHIWCRAGICLEDFEAHKGEIRAACYARDARVTRNTRWSQLVTIDIIRHDPLSAGHRVPSQITKSPAEPLPAAELAAASAPATGAQSDPA